ncbi:hypothetical protein ACFL3Z_01840 [Gemmatimonadota bacterium]
MLNTLPGVISVRVVARPGGEMEEIHLLTTTEVSPKQTVRNAESALKAHFHLEVDHRIISVAQSSDPPPEVKEPEVLKPVLVERLPSPSGARILFLRHQVATERGHRLRVSVTVEWDGHEYLGEAMGTDLPRSRLETVAKATLDAIEQALNDMAGGAAEDGLTLALDGVKVVEAFDRDYVLVGVNAIHQREIAALAGASAVEDTTDRAVILATLQATDRWVRGRL